MILEKIITLANASVRLRFTAMVRSLRSTGCQLPVWVIPYDDATFELPDNCFWWREDAFLTWLDGFNAFRACRKYQCFLTSNYQFVDSDVVFLRNPAEVLKGHSGFVASCSHWRYAGHTYTEESLRYMRSKSTMWQSKIFNSGQFACDRQLYDLEKLKNTCTGDFKDTLLLKTGLYKDQPAINLLVHLSEVPIYNLTLPPVEMESTWAGDYFLCEGKIDDVDPEYYWTSEDKKPYLIHWAGCEVDNDYKIHALFTRYLTVQEMEEWQKFKQVSRRNRIKATNGILPFLRKLKRAVKILQA